MDGVTLTFDLNTQEPGAFSDADAETLNNWLATDDGRLLQDACVAVIDQGAQQIDPEALQNYYAVAMLVDTHPPPQSKSNETKNSALHASLARFQQRLPQQRNVSIMKASWLSDNSLPDKDLLLTGPCSSPQGGCYGCCGWGAIALRTVEEWSFIIRIVSSMIHVAANTEDWAALAYMRWLGRSSRFGIGFGHSEVTP
jgi:hypothetical protein